MYVGTVPLCYFTVSKPQTILPASRKLICTLDFCWYCINTMFVDTISVKSENVSQADQEIFNMLFLDNKLQLFSRKESGF